MLVALFNAVKVESVPLNFTEFADNLRYGPWRSPVLVEKAG